MVNVYEFLEKIGGHETILQFEVARRMIPMLDETSKDVPGEALEIAKSIIESMRNNPSIDLNRIPFSPDVNREIIQCFREKSNGGGALDVRYTPAYGRALDASEATQTYLG